MIKGFYSLQKYQIKKWNSFESSGSSGLYLMKYVYISLRLDQYVNINIEVAGLLGRTAWKVSSFSGLLFRRYVWSSYRCRSGEWISDLRVWIKSIITTDTNVIFIFADLVDNGKSIQWICDLDLNHKKELKNEGAVELYVLYQFIIDLLILNIVIYIVMPPNLASQI
jgi:hypothetical protein